MSRVSIYVFLLVCLISKNLEITSELNLTPDIVQVMTASDKNSKLVKLFETIECDILWNQPKTRVSDKDLGYALYTGLTCIVSKQTTIDLQNIVKQFPLFYQREFIGTKWSQVFQRYFETFFNTICSINQYIERSINLLYEFIEVFNSTYYYDVSILKTLLSLHIKLSFMSLKKNELLPEFLESDAMVIQEILEEINAVQSFLTTHCLARPFHTQNSHLFGYSNLNTKFSNTSTSIEHVLKVAHSKLKLEPGLNDCSIERSFLNDIVSIESTDPISNDIVESKVIVNGKAVKLKDIYNRFRQTYDIELLHLYLESVLFVIIKILCTLVLNALHQDQSLPEVKKIISVIHLEISKDSKNFPSYVADGFALLAKVQNIEKKIEYESENNSEGNSEGYSEGDSEGHSYEDQEVIMEDDKKYYSQDDLEVIKELYDFCNSLKVQIKFTIPFNVARNYNDGKIEIKKFKLIILRPDTKQDIIRSMGKDPYKNTPILNFDYLERFLSKISYSIEDFSCIHQLLKRIQVHYNKYYSQLVNKIKKLRVPENGKNLCNLFLDMYLNCYNTIVFLNQSEEKENNVSHLSDAWNSLQHIEEHFTIILNNDKDNLDLLNVAFNIVTILANQNKPTNTTEILQHFKRVINMIMVELDSYGIQYCSIHDFEFLLVNNVNFISFEKKNAKKYFDDGITYFEQNNLDSWHTEDNSTKNCFDIRHLYNTYIRRAEVFFNTYKNYVLVLWKGKGQTIQEIVDDITVMFINPRYLHAFYDMYYNFFIAAVFFEVKSLYSKFGSRWIHQEVDQDNIIPITKFPKKFKTLISDVNHLWNIRKSNDDNIQSEIKNRFESIQNQLERIFEFKFDARYQSRHSFNGSITHITNQILATSSAYECYTKITNFNNIKNQKFYLDKKMIEIEKMKKKGKPVEKKIKEGERPKKKPSHYDGDYPLKIDMPTNE